jgi:hypothetical protein
VDQGIEPRPEVCISGDERCRVPRVIRLLLSLVFVGACTVGPSRPLAEAILGEWEVLCRTDQEPTATCLGKEDRGMYKRFLAAGKLVSGAREGIAMHGTWTLTDGELVLAFEGGGMKLVEAYKARIEDDRLVLWNPQRGFGAVHGRVGAPFAPVAGKQSAGERTSHAIGGVGYTIALPAGYRLSRDDNERQKWSPAFGAGFIVELSVSPRPQRQVEGQWVTPPCDDRDYGGVASSRAVIDGLQRDTSIGRSVCLDGSDRVLSCSAEHTRGFLEKAEMDDALALCNSIAVER